LRWISPLAWWSTLAAGAHSGTLVNALLHHFGSLSQLGGELRPGIVHRLDRQTSGVLLVARHDAAHRNLAGQFAARQVEKVYLALVHGSVKGEQGRIDKPISRDPAKRVRMTARRGQGRTAITGVPRAAPLPGLHAARSANQGPAAPTRSARISRVSATPWRATASTAHRPGSRTAGRSPASSCMRTGSASRSRDRGFRLR